ncbi:MAG: radical SAM protein [Candidatus Pacearchaeota archaeon]
MTQTIENVLDRFPLRISITDGCNLACAICSNEGLGLANRNTVSVNPGDFRYLVNTLTSHGLQHISLSGGDPTVHPAAREMVEIVNQSGVAQRFYHTNGILLTRDGLVDALADFTKIGVSLHGTDSTTYGRITRGTPTHYGKVREGLQMLGERGLGKKVEVKHVTVKGINDDPESLRGTLDLCADYGFKFKFLNFEAIRPDQVDLVQDVAIIEERLRGLGAVPLTESGKVFRGQTDYLPIKWYEYKGTKGVVIEVGCGTPAVCKACHDSNEIFVTPSLDIKPCKASGRLFSLKGAIDSRDEEGLVGAILDSREFLKTQPGLGRQYWEVAV